MRKFTTQASGSNVPSVWTHLLAKVICRRISSCTKIHRKIANHSTNVPCVDVGSKRPTIWRCTPGFTPEKNRTSVNTARRSLPTRLDISDTCWRTVPWNRLSVSSAIEASRTARTCWFMRKVTAPNGTPSATFVRRSLSTIGILRSIVSDTFAKWISKNR